MTRDEACDVSGDDGLLFCDGFDDALIGVCERFNMRPVACYDIQKMVDIMTRRDNCTYEEAIEYLEFNTFGAWVGEYTPAFLRTYS